MIHLIIAHNYEIAKTTALIDWGWSMFDRSNGIFKNLAGEKVRYSSTRHPEYLIKYPKGTKLYFVKEGALQSDIDRLSQAISGLGFEFIRNEGNEGKVNG